MEAVNGVSEADKGGPPAPSPLTGCYLLVVVGEPHSKEHKDIILRRVAKGLLSWDISDCHVDLEKELAIITEQAPEGEDARYGERLIQFASENLVTEILIHPAISTLSQCMKNLLSSFTRHRHIIHAGYTFAANGSWILQDGTFSLTDFSEAFQEMEVQRVLRAYDNSISLDIHCSPEGDWTRLPKESFAKNCKVRVNPDDVLTSGSPSIVNFLNYISPFLVPTDIETLLESSDVVGNIRFSHPTLYVFPGGQGDAALFGINGFNMLVDGGFARKACFWDFVRHLDRLDAVLLTRLNNCNVSGISSVLRRKRFNTVYPQIGHFFCNIQERKAILSPDGDKDRDPLIVNLLDEGQEIVSNLRQLHLQPQGCYRDIEPINLYHKVGHGTLDMYVLSPAKESKEVKEFIQKWNTNDQRLFANQRNGRDFTFPTQNLVSICALLVWQPANANDSITRILFPGSTPQHKIFEGLDRLKQLECIKYPSCSAKTLTPSLMKSKQAKVEKIIQQEQKENKKERLLQQPESKAKMENKVAEENIKNTQTNGVTPHQVITDKIIKKHDSTESEKSGPQSGEAKKPEEGKEPSNLTNGKASEEKVEKAKPKAKPEQKPKVEAKVYKHTRSIERKPKPSAEKKASPTTPKKTLDAKMNGDGPIKPKTLSKISPSATPAKSAKEANNRKVVESKYKVAPKKDVSKPDKKEAKPERKPISRRPKESSPSGKILESPVKKLNELHKVEARKSKLEKEGTTDSSTVSTPTADAETAMKKDISKLTPEELEQLKARELAELKEEQEVVKEIEAVFRKSEHKVTDESDLRKVKNISVDDKTEGEGEEYLIIEKEEIEHDSLDEKETKESETQKHLRDSEESEKQRKLSGEVTVEVKDIKEEKPAEAATLDESVKVQDNEAMPTTDVAKAKDESEQPREASKEVSAASPDDKVDLSSGKKVTDRDIDEENKDANILESQPDEKFSTPIESGATTAPTLPEDERIPLDEIKEDNGDQIIEEKYVKEDTKEKEIPVVQLPPKTTETVAKLPTVVGIRLDKQTPIRDLVKTPDEVADLPVHEEVDIENYEHYHATQSQTPKQEEIKQISTAKEAKPEKAETEPLAKPDEKVSTATEEKELDKKIDDAQKIADAKQEPTKAVEEKAKLIESHDAKETPIKVVEIEAVEIDAKPHLKEHPEKDHEEEKVDLEKEKIEKTVEKVDEEKQEVEKADLGEIQVKVDKLTEEKVEEGKAEIEEVPTTADVQKKEMEEIPEKEEIKKPTEKHAVAKAEPMTEDDLTEAKVEKEALTVDIGKDDIEKQTQKDDVKKVEAEKDVAKHEVEKATEVDVEKAEVEEHLPTATNGKNELKRVAEKGGIEKTVTQEKVGDKEAEKETAVEVDVEKLTPKVVIEQEITKKEKEEVKEPTEKMDVPKVEVDNLDDETGVTKTVETKKTESKLDEKDKNEEEAVKTETVQKLEGAVEKEEEHIEHIDTEKTRKEDTKEVEAKVELQGKGVANKTNEVKQESFTKIKASTHRDEQIDDVEAKIVAIEKELVAVITEEAKEIEKMEEKVDVSEKEQKVVDIAKVDIEKEKAAVDDVKEGKADEVKITKQEISAEVKISDTIHGEIIEEKPVTKLDDKEAELRDKKVEKTIEELEAKVEDVSAKQPEEVFEDQLKTADVSDLKVTTEVKSEETKKEVEGAENIDKQIVDLEKPDIKLEDVKIFEKGLDLVVPHVKSVEQAKEEVEDISTKEPEVKPLTAVSIKEVEEQLKADQHKDETKEQKLEDLGKMPIEDDKKEPSEEKTSKVDVDKIDLKDIENEKLAEQAKSEIDKDNKIEKVITDKTQVTKDRIKPLDKDVLADDKTADVIDPTLKSSEKVESKALPTDRIIEEEKQKIEVDKVADSKDFETVTKEKIYHEPVTMVEAEKKSQAFAHAEAEETQVKTDILIPEKDLEQGHKQLVSQILEPSEVKEISEKKESPAEGKLIARESGEKHSDKDVEDIKDVEKVVDTKKDVADLKLDDEKSDKEKSAVEQKEEDTGKSDKPMETVTIQPMLDEKIDQTDKHTKKDKEEKPEIKIADVKEDTKIGQEIKETKSEKGEDKQEEILSQTTQANEKLENEREVEERKREKENEKLTENIEQSSTTKHERFEDPIKDEKKDEGKVENLFKDEEELIKPVKSLSSEEPPTAEIGKVINFIDDKEVAKDLQKMDTLSKTDEKERSAEVKSEDQEKDQVCKVEKVLEKVEEVTTAKIKETEEKMEEASKSDKTITTLATELKIETDLKESLAKADSSLNKQEHETDFKVSKSDVTKLPEDDKSVVVGDAKKQIEPEKISVSVEKSDKAPSLETSKTEEKTVQQGEKDYVGETGEKTAIKSFHDDSVEISKINKKLQDLKEAASPEDKIELIDADLEHSTKSQGQNKNEIDVVDKLELGRKSPKEREQDVAIIVASVAEVLKSDAPLEEFEGKIPLEITTFGPYELRETHITTVESPIREDIIVDIQMRPIEEEKSSPRDSISVFLYEERKVAPVHTDYDNFQKGESRVSSLLKDSNELIQATSKIISDIKQSSKVDDDADSEDIKETSQTILEKAPITTTDLVVDSKEPVLEKPSSVLEESSPKAVGFKEEHLDIKKESSEIKECDIKVDSLLVTKKSTPDIKEKVQGALDVDKLQSSSGKSSPEMKEPPKETVDVDNSIISSGKASPDIKVEEVATSGKSTPEVLESIKKSDIEESQATVLSGKSSPEVKVTTVDSIPSGKATPEIKEGTDDKDVIISGKTTSEMKEHVTDLSKSIIDSDKVTSDIKETVKSSFETTPLTSGKTTADTKEPVSDPSQSIIDSGKVTSDVKQTVESSLESTPITSGKATPDIKESVADLSKSIIESEKVTSDVKETVKSSLESTPITSGKSTPEIKELIADLSKSIIAPEKVTSDVKESVKSSLESTPITSGKSTPEIKEPIADLSKSIIEPEKVTSDVKETVKSSLESTPISSGIATSEIKESATDLSKTITDPEKVTSDIKETVKSAVDSTPIASGKATPEIKEPITDLSKSVIDSAKITSDIKEIVKSSMDTTPVTSGKATPEIKEPVTDIAKSIIGSEKVTQDVKDTVKSSLDSTPIASEKTTPEIKEVMAELPKTLVGSEKISADIKESTKSSLDTSPVTSGKTTPEIREPTVSKDISSGKTTPDIIDKAAIVPGKAIPDEIVKDALTTGQSSIISGKSTPEIIEPVKDTLDTTKSPMLSGMSTPDIVIDEDNSSVASGRSTPDIEISVDKHLEDLEKCSTDTTDLVASQKISDAKHSTTQIEPEKKVIESEKHGSEIKVADIGPVQSEIPPIETIQITVKSVVTETTSPAEASKTSEATRKLSLDKSKSPVTSGKSTPDPQHSTKNGIDQIKSPVDSRKSSLKEPIDVDRSSTASGKFTPELKDPVSVISGRATPDTKLQSEKDSVKPEISTSEIKGTSITPDSKVTEVKDLQTISEHTTKIESIAGPSSSSKDGRLSPTKSPTEEYSRKSTPDIADITKTKDLEESSSGKTTPPTVPVSPVVKEKHPSVDEQEKSGKKDIPEVYILKATEARSSTPGSDDCDISSGQVSRVLTTEEDDYKQVYSDDEDLPGSPLSATSQVAHSTSSQYDFEDSVRGVGPIDPMSTSFYGALPDDPVDLSKGAKTSRFLDEADLDFDKALHEHRQTRGEDLTSGGSSGASPSHVYEITTAKYSSIKLQEESETQKPVSSAPVTIPKESLMTSSFIGSELPTDPKDDPIASWGKPLGLPSPAPLNDNKGTPKKERRIPPNVMAKNKLNEDKKLSDSKYDRRGKKINPVYVDLTYVPHHGNSNYSYVDFFKRVRARYYVFSGIEPSKEVYNALLEAKQTWDDKELEVTIIPTYDTDVLGYWVAENEDLLAKYKIDLSPSASRCTINLQDHETSCSAYRLEFS